MVVELLDRLASLGTRVEVVRDKLRLVNGGKLPPELVDTVRQHKAEIMSVLQSHKGPVLSMLDTDFPAAYRGLPQKPVALGLEACDALGQTDAVLRKANVLALMQFWLLDRYQNIDTGAFDDAAIAKLFEGVKAEQSRLLACHEAANADSGSKRAERKVRRMATTAPPNKVNKSLAKLKVQDWTPEPGLFLVGAAEVCESSRRLEVSDDP